MSAIYVVREYVEAHNQVLDSIENATQALRSFERGTEDVIEATEEMEGVAEKLQDAVGGVSKETVVLSNKLDFIKKRFSEVGEVIMYGAKTIIEYNDAARLSIRGTSLMSASTEEMRKSVNGLTTLGPKVAEAMSYSSKEATQFSATLASDMERVSGSLDIADASKQIQEYAKNVRGSATLLNMSSADMMAIQHQMVGQAHVSLKDLQGMMAEAASYATSLGLEGKDVQEMTAKHMETVMALDKDSRKSYISDLMYAAGVQKRAAIDFGKYATPLSQKEGAESMGSEYLIAALSGVDVSEVSSAIARAGVDPAKQQEIFGKALQGVGVDLKEYQSQFSKRAAGEEYDYESLKTMEIAAKVLTDQTGQSLSTMLGLENALKETNIPTKEEAKAAIPQLTGEDNQKAIQDRLLTTEETTARFTAKVADLAVSAADASGALGTMTDTVRDIIAAAAVAKGAVPGISGGFGEFMSNTLSGTLSGLLGSGLGKLGGTVMKGGRKLLGMGGKEAAEAAVESGVKVAGKEAAEAAVESGVKVAGKEAAEAAVESGVKVAGKEAAEAAVESGVKVAGKEAAEAVGKKAIGKSLLKKIPGIGLLTGAGFALGRAWEGDYAGAGLELASGAASTIPGIGTAASIAIDAAAAARDINKAVNEPEVEKVDPNSKTTEMKNLSSPKVTELKKEQQPIGEVERVKPQDDKALASLEQALGGMKMTGVERHLVGNRKVLEELIPIMAEMRDSVISRSSSLVSAI